MVSELSIAQLVKQEKAQTLIEAAIALPVLLLLFFGCMELVHVAVGHIVVREAAFEAGRQASINKNADYATKVAISICGKISKGETTFEIEDRENNKKSYVVTHHLKPWVPIIPGKEISHQVPDYLFYSGD